MIEVGSLGSFPFPAGYFVYTGSAMGGLEARISRHLRRRKKMWWHIDYLLQRGSVVRVIRYAGQTDECGLNRKVGRLPDAEIVIRRFGCSDCRCPTHLFYFRKLSLIKLGTTPSSQDFEG